MFIAYFNAGISIQPHLLALPVVAPNSLPTLEIFSPTSSNNSVGNGPLPTLVQYALKIPNTSPILFGAIPSPVQAPADIVFDDVTNGYDPKSISSKVPCAPSASIFFLFFKASCI